jgi:hypothetical protein
MALSKGVRAAILILIIGSTLTIAVLSLMSVIAKQTPCLQVR